VNATITGLPDPSQNIWDLWDCLEELEGDGGQHGSNLTLIIDNNTTTRWVKAAMKLNSSTLFCIVYHVQQAEGRSGALTPMFGGHSYLPVHHILPPPAKDMIDNIRVEWDNDAEIGHSYPRSFLTMKIGFPQFSWKLQRRISRQQRFLEVIPYCAFGLLADYEQSIVTDEDVAWLPKHNHIVNPPTVSSLANRKPTSSCPAANLLLGEWNALAAQLHKDLHCGWVFLWHFGGSMDQW